MLKEGKKERDAQIVEVGNDNERQEMYDSLEEDGNATRDGQIVNDSEAISTLKLQLELEKLKAMRSEADAKRVEMELIMQRERVTLSADQSSDQAARSDDTGERSDIKHLLPRMSEVADFDCLLFFHTLEITFNFNGVAKCMWPKLLIALLSSHAQKKYFSQLSAEC